MSYFVELNDLMSRYGFQPDKKMAQFFVMDETVVAKFVELAELKKTDVVLEVGAGTGFLTREIQKHCKVIAYELDDELFELLQKELPKENLELFHENFLKVSLPKFNKIVCLPPYTISSDIIFKTLEFEPELVVMAFQREFVEKLRAQPGFQEYSALSVLVQYYFDVQFIQHVPADCFFPQPKAVSSIVKMVLKKEAKIRDKKLFEHFVKNLFRFQNKNLKKALNHSFQFIGPELGLNEKAFKKILEKLELGNVKVNLIEVEEFAELFGLFNKKEKDKSKKAQKKTKIGKTAKKEKLSKK